LAAHTQDDGFHEIQLNGKQLVFLFMAATVVSVVIFLCGVLVGRGVRAERGSEAETAELNAPSEPAPQQAASPATPTPTGSDPTTAAAAPPAVDDLSYFNRLQATKPPPEKLKAPERSAAATSGGRSAAPATPAGQSAAAAPPAGQPAATPPVEKAPVHAAVPEAAPGNTPRGTGGYAVQIAALNLRSEADAIAKKLSAKGYAAYVLNPAAGTPQIYRVRIGKYGSRREAETIATKLEKEEQFKPWVTR
jgi:cell division septation protein DedD